MDIGCNMKVILFDMDGTLTLPKRKMGMFVASMLARLQKNGFIVGIVTGADIQSVKSQCEIMWDISPVDPSEMDFFTCNGTRYLTVSRFNEWSEHYAYDMRAELGTKVFNDIIFKIFEYQANLKNHQYGQFIPLAGNFVDYRNSMINWSPIGRNATFEQREAWKKIDRQYSARKLILNNYFHHESFVSCRVKLGGETSFDISPIGWNKSIALNNYSKDDKIWFVGDKCNPDGNDYEIFKKLKLKNRAFETSGPNETIEIVDQILAGEKDERC